jgi:hypothetical protein
MPRLLLPARSGSRVPSFLQPSSEAARGRRAALDPLHSPSLPISPPVFSRFQVVTLERPLPYPVSPRLNRVTFHTPDAAAAESGVEGFTLRFKWELYAGHHLVSCLVPSGTVRCHPGYRLVALRCPASCRGAAQPCRPRLPPRRGTQPGSSAACPPAGSLRGLWQLLGCVRRCWMRHASPRAAAHTLLLHLVPPPCLPAPSPAGARLEWGGAGVGAGLLGAGHRDDKSG